MSPRTTGPSICAVTEAREGDRADDVRVRRATRRPSSSCPFAVATQQTARTVQRPGLSFLTFGASVRVLISTSVVLSLIVYLPGFETSMYGRGPFSVSTTLGFVTGVETGFEVSTTVLSLGLVVRR